VGQAKHGETVRPDRSPGGVRCGHEVGQGSDRWAPPVCDSGARDPLGSGRREEGVGAQLLGWFGSGLGELLGRTGERREGGKTKQAALGGEED